MAFVRRTLSIALIIMCWAAAGVFFASRGLDVSDEGSLLLSVSSDPGVYFNSPFFLALQPIWDFVGQELFSYRLVSFFAITGVSIYWGVAAVRFFSLQVSKRTGFTLTLASMIFTVASFFNSGGLTPSYNGLAFSGSLVVTAAVMHVTHCASTKPSVRNSAQLAAHACAAGMGLTVASFGRLSTALLLSMALAVSLLFLPAAKAKVVLIVGAATAFVISLALWPNLDSPWNLVELYMEGARRSLLMDPGYGPLSSLEFLVRTMGPPFMMGAVLWLLAMALERFSSVRVWSTTPLLVLILSLPAFFAVKAVGLTFSVLGGIALAFGFWRLYVFASRVKNRVTLDRREVLGDLLLATTAVAPLLGSNTGFVNSESFVAPYIFGILLLSLRGRATDINKIALVAVSLLTAVVIFVSAATHPFRQGSLFNQSNQFRVANGTILVDAGFASEIELLRYCVTRNGLSEGQTLDFTKGWAPGVVFLLGLTPPSNLLGTIWGYDGASEQLRDFLERNRSVNWDLALVDTGNYQEAYGRASEVGISLGQVSCSGSRWSLVEIEKAQF